ncbi:MAG: hypothetical protein KGJ57_05780 [Sphingomonadales bacterium]|nr:hypothetical protein [Sphingomonadales bacterium]MDE2168928.1 hypothetical protein [Sphingomonadales bacterium]
MYRKDADRLIVRDVIKQLRELQERLEWADWRLAVSASCAQHPEWYRHHQPLHQSVKPLLLDSGVNMSEKPYPFTIVGNTLSED